MRAHIFEYPDHIITWLWPFASTHLVSIIITIIITVWSKYTKFTHTHIGFLCLDDDAVATTNTTIHPTTTTTTTTTTATTITIRLFLLLYYFHSFSLSLLKPRPPPLYANGAVHRKQNTHTHWKTDAGLFSTRCFDPLTHTHTQRTRRRRRRRTICPYFGDYLLSSSFLSLRVCQSTCHHHEQLALFGIFFVFLFPVHSWSSHLCFTYFVFCVCVCVYERVRVSEWHLCVYVYLCERATTTVDIFCSRHLHTPTRRRRSSSFFCQSRILLWIHLFTHPSTQPSTHPSHLLFLLSLSQYAAHWQVPGKNLHQDCCFVIWFNLIT